MSAQDERQAEWEAFTSAQHAKGLCEFSGLRVSRCVGSICDCFETPEGAAEIERNAKFDQLVEAGEVCHCGQPVDRSEFRNRGMCTHCDDTRCDAYPGECGR